MSRAAPQQESGVDHAAKAALFDTLAEAAAALAAGRRLEIVDLLAQGERSVEEVAAEVRQSTANTSHHLRALARASLVTSRRDGTRIYYRLANDDVEALWAALRRVAESVQSDLNDRLQGYLGDQSEIEVVGREELVQRLAAGTVTVLDVRPLPEYRSGHIPGARSVPLTELAGIMAELPEGLTVVAYCRGPYCVFASAAVRLLRARGIEAARLEDGFPEWRRAALPVVVGNKAGRLPARIARRAPGVPRRRTS